MVSAVDHGDRRYILARVLAVISALVLLSGCGTEGTASTTEQGVPSVLRVGLIPNIAPDEQRARYQPLGDYLAEQLDVEVELFVASDYAGVVNALASGHLDVAYLGGLTYAQANEQVELTPLVTEVDADTGTRNYISAIVVREDAPYGSLDDLLDDEASFAFGDVSSTSGSLYPRIMLVDAGAECSASELVSCPPLSEITFSGGHDATARSVLSGTVDAGGLELRILRRLERDGAVPAGELRVIAETDVMGYPWVARTELGAEAHDRVSEAFLAIEDASLLDLLRAEDYERVSEQDYGELRARAEDLGLLTVEERR